MTDAPGPTFREWLTRIYGSQLNQAGHLARLLAEEPTFPDDPSWADLLDWVAHGDAASPMSRNDGLIVTTTLHWLMERYREDRGREWKSFKAWEGK